MSPTYRITGLHYTYGCTTFSRAYVDTFFFGITGFHLSNGCPALSAAFFLLGLLTESVDHIRLMGARLNDAPP